MNDLIVLLWTGVGFVAGLIFALFGVMLWISLAGALQEWICEVTLDKWYGASKFALKSQPVGDGNYSLLISDIHLDTWTFPDKPNDGDPDHPNRLAFRAFLNWVKNEPRFQDLYINGDIMDFPPHPINQPPVPTLKVIYKSPENVYPDLEHFSSLGSLNPLNERVLFQLGRISDRNPAWPTLRVTYITGNHDLGLYGLRYIQPDLNWNSFRVAWNPSILLSIGESTRLYMEHGHLHDPFIWLYLRYAIGEIIQGPGSTIQHPMKVGKTKHKNTVSRDVEPDQGPRYFEGRGSIALSKKDGLGPLLARLRFRQAARRTFRQVQKIEKTSIQFLTMGHTHLPDRYIFPGNRTYINSGDWAGNDVNCTYLLIHPNGEITGPHQWRDGTTLDDLIGQ